MTEYIWIGIVLLLIAVGIAILLTRKRTPEFIGDELEGHEFEHYCADLLKKDGFQDIYVTKGSGDFGADILAEKAGVTFAFQCKCYTEPVGVKAVQEIYAGRDYYDRMVGVVMSNQYFTEPARKAADKLKIILWDRDYLMTLEEE